MTMKRAALILFLLVCRPCFAQEDAYPDPNGEGIELRSGTRPSPFRRTRVEAGLTPAELAQVADNCQFGMPKVEAGTDLGPIRIIARDGYVLGHSSESKIPYWVCEHSTVDELSGPGDRDASRFLPDPKLAGFPRAELADYRGSGYDRGHMHPAANAKKSQQMMDETHFLSNMVPQYGPTFNQGIWAQLESKVRDWTRARNGTWVISGPMFYDPLEESEETADGEVPYYTIGEDEVAVPTHCYKIVVAKNASGDWESIAFVFDNDRHGAPYRLAPHRATIHWIEERTGINFFPELDADPTLKDRLEAHKSPMWETE